MADEAVEDMVVAVVEAAMEVEVALMVTVMAATVAMEVVVDMVEMEVMAEGAVEVTVAMEVVEATEVADTKKCQGHRAANSYIKQHRAASRSSEKLYSIYYGRNWLISAF